MIIARISFSHLKNRGENPTSKKIDLRCHRAGSASSGWLTVTASTTSGAGRASRSTVYMERGRRGGMTRAPGSGPTTVAGLPQGSPVLPVLRALLPPLPPLPPPGHRARSERAAVFPDLRGVPGGGCAGAGVGVVRHSGGVRAWDAPAVLDDVYMTHSSGGSGHGIGAHGRLHVQCPTCRRAVAGERDHEHSPSGARVASEQFERLIVLLGSEPGDPPVYVLRVPRIAFPEHVNREGGRLRDSIHGVGRDRGTPRASSRGSAPATPTPARSPRGRKAAGLPPSPVRRKARRRTRDGLLGGAGPALATIVALSRSGNAVTATGAAGGAAAVGLWTSRATAVPGDRSWRGRSRLA